MTTEHLYHEKEVWTGYTNVEFTSLKELGDSVREVLQNVDRYTKIDVSVRFTKENIFFPSIRDDSDYAYKTLIANMKIVEHFDSIKKGSWDE